ncbi:hypothetical protein BDZ97DRAFT_3737 [Flammula alnicola]|nr:hypothetical protein BDZ97DRAFT_3737 [Flammula alnicola]
MLTTRRSPPAFGLGLEKASTDLMRKPPHSTKVITDSPICCVVSRSVFVLVNPVTRGQFFAKDLLANPILLWSEIGGMSGIGWEWGIVVGMSIVFFIWCEIWKIFRKRRLYTRWALASIEIPTSKDTSVEKRHNGV